MVVNKALVFCALVLSLFSVALAFDNNSAEIDELQVLKVNMTMPNCPIGCIAEDLENNCSVNENLIYNAEDIFPTTEQQDVDLNLQEQEAVSNAAGKHLLLVDRMRELLSKKRNTDCKFIVGQTKKEFESHRAILSGGSPILQQFFTGHETEPYMTIALPDIPEIAFDVILDFMYTDEICINDFETACELLKTAAKFKLDYLEEKAKDFMFSTLESKNAWAGYHCAVSAKNEKLKNLALQIIAENTEGTLADPNFVKISHEMLVDLLKRDDLNVKESLILDATIRWAMAEVERKNITPTPESVRNSMGSALSHVRFLALTPEEFANIQSTSKILSYSESLAVIFNLNAPNVTPLPKTISTNKTPRKNVKLNTTPTMYISEPMICTKYDNIVKKTSNEFSRTINNNNYRTQAIFTSMKVPARICQTPNELYEEDIIIEASGSNEIETRHFKKNVTCGQLIKIEFTPRIHLKSGANYKFTVKMQKPGFYPKYGHNNAKVGWGAQQYESGSYFREYEFSAPGFIYSLKTTNDYNNIYQ